MREDIIVLGATGSIGRQCLEILRYSDRYRLVGVSLNTRYEILEDYLLYFDGLRKVAITDPEKAKEFQARHPDLTVYSGEEASLTLVKKNPQATVFNSLLGNVGLRPSLLALRQHQDLLLANKESLVIGSSLIQKELRKTHGHLYPVDSEHVGLAKLLSEARRLGIHKDQIRSLTVTASGGSLRDVPKEDLPDVTPEQVLHHPTWAMGPKITCDSATLVNKGYEVIEASVLFGFPLSRVNAIICRESLVHAELTYVSKGHRETIVEYSPCDMKVAIAYALSKGKLTVHQNGKEDQKAIGRLHFAPVDETFYPCFRLTIRTYEKYGNAGMIFYNAVDTLAVKKFLAKEIPYSDILTALRYTYECMPALPVLSEKNLPAIEKQAEAFASQVLLRCKLFLRR
jgi:1-deoxy-D-xylulose-5-phosphate reductoisomerase